MLVHALAFYWALVAPALSWWSYQRDKALLRAGDTAFRFRLYRRVLIRQGLTVLAIVVLIATRLAPAAAMGLRSPRSWPLTIGLSLGAIAALLWTALKLRPRAQELREKMRDRGGAVLPETDPERRWFAAISMGAGVAEELSYRGFMFFYLAAHIPGINTVECVLLTSMIFGMAHIYQGWRGILTTGIAGLVLACAYVLTGNLLLPVVLHATGNVRGALIFRGEGSAPSEGSV